MTTYTYQWAAADQSVLFRFDEHGNRLGILADPAYAEYRQFLEEGAEAAPYEAPPAPPEPSPEEKLAASGLTVEELKTLLGL